MTIYLSLAQTSDLDALARALYRELTTAGCPDLASEAACLRTYARDAVEYLSSVLQLSDELKVEWREVAHDA